MVFILNVVVFILPSLQGFSYFLEENVLGTRLALQVLDSLNLYAIEQTATSLQGSRFVIREKE